MRALLLEGIYIYSYFLGVEWGWDTFSPIGRHLIKGSAIKGKVRTNTVSLDCIEKFQFWILFSLLTFDDTSTLGSKIRAFQEDHSMESKKSSARVSVFFLYTKADASI